jgi:hypothetical protein
MCGRFVRSSPIEKIRIEFRAKKALDEIGASYKIAPTRKNCSTCLSPILLS